MSYFFCTTHVYKSAEKLGKCRFRNKRGTWEKQKIEHEEVDWKEEEELAIVLASWNRNLTLLVCGR